MKEESIPEGIEDQDWRATPLRVQERLLWLMDEVNRLKGRVESLEEQLRKNSSNSSKPPSSDGPNTPKQMGKQPTGGKSGAQPGHQGRGRSLKPTAEVDQVIKLRPVECRKCGALLLGEDENPARHQVTEIPKVEPIVIEYQRHCLKCLACGVNNEADWPKDMPRGSFGPRLQATVGYLTGSIGASQRDAEEVINSLFDVEISLGSIAAVEQQVSKALEKPVQEIEPYLQKQVAQNVDETSWKEKGKRTWLWVVTTQLVTMFLLMAGRGQQQAKQAIGKNYQGIVGSDRCPAYNWINPKQRQVCWSHLKRDFQAFVERGGESKAIGDELVELTKQLFELWHKVKVGTLCRIEFQIAVIPIQERVGELLRTGAILSVAQTRRTCLNLLKLEVSLWTFVWIEGVEPTNNAAEQAVRRGVIWRKSSFGTQSADGSRFVERILTAVATLRKQKRNVLDYLTQACRAAIAGTLPPSLLPKPP